MLFLQSEQCCDCLFASLGPIYTGELFQIFILDESICHFRGVGSILLLQFYSFFFFFLMENPVSKHCRP